MRKLSVVLAIILMLSLIGCGSASSSGLATINDVDGVSFGVVSDVIRNATATTSIAKDISFEPNQTYLYKNGDTQYFLFNISSIVLAVQKDTTFNLSDAKDKQSAILNNNLLGIWFDVTGTNKKISIDKKNSEDGAKYIATVNGEVTINDSLYNNFTGKLAIIERGGKEWSMFVGTVGDDYDSVNKDVSKLLNAMVDSFQISNIQETESAPAISVGGTDSSQESTTVSKETAASTSSTQNATVKESESVSEVPSESIESISVQEESSSVATGNVATDNTEQNTSTEAATTESVAAESTTSVSIVETTADIPETSSQQSSVQEETESTENITKDKDKSPKQYINLSNQKEKKKVESNKVYKSTIYNMLDAGQWGFAHVYQPNIKDFDTVAIRVDNVYANDEAISMIKKVCTDKQTDFNYFDAPKGCSWQVAEYEVNYMKSANPSDAYINIKMCGVDGKNLNYRGIKYTDRTYDLIKNKNKYYVFYAVPNGCSEYVLECGDGTIENGKLSAYVLCH